MDRGIRLYSAKNSGSSYLFCFTRGNNNSRKRTQKKTAVGLYGSANEATSAESFEHEDEHDVLGTSCRPKSWPAYLVAVS
jgi:hypothetical protein